LEQAASADMTGIKKLARKHAFHSVMAARRFEQSGQVSTELTEWNTKSELHAF
jgi:hypothetical protein